MRYIRQTMNSTSDVALTKRTGIAATCVWSMSCTLIMRHRRRLSGADRGARQSEMRAQRLALIAGSHQAALLQQRQHLGGEKVELMRQHWRHQVETVGRPSLEPCLHDVGDLLRRSGERKMAARTGELGKQFS